MKTRPILFSASMVRAILDGRKTQTRRIAAVDCIDDHPAIPGAKVITLLNGKQGWLNCQTDHPHHFSRICPYGQPGDRLWVKESHRLLDCECKETCRTPGHVWYDADESGYEGAFDRKLRPSIYMPRWASRITLEITSVRVERLNDISEEDAVAEGMDVWNREVGSSSAYLQFVALWESINGVGSWDCNPWVWVIDFRRIRRDA